MPPFPEKVPQVSIGRELEYDVERTVERAAPEQVDDVLVFPDQLHELHLRDEPDDVVI